MRKFLFVSALFLLPTLVLGAGFAKQSIFLSKSSVTEGDTVRIHATVSNDGTAPFTGSVVVKDGSSKLGSAAVTLAAGAAQAISVSWTPTAGTHTIVAALEGSDGSVVEQESADFTIAARPKPVVVAPVFPVATDSGQSAAVESSAQLQKDIAGISPQAGQLSQPLFSVIDSLRGNMSKLIDSQLGIAKNNLANSSQAGLVEGTSSTLGVPSTSGSFWFIPWTIYLYVLTILQFLISSAGIFYPLLAVIFFYLLYRTYRWARRPSY
jgi:hypothetical protein